MHLAIKSKGKIDETSRARPGRAVPGLLDGRWEEVADETGALFFFFFLLLQMVLFDVELKESDGQTDGRTDGRTVGGLTWCNSTKVPPPPK